MRQPERRSARHLRGGALLRGQMPGQDRFARGWIDPAWRGLRLAPRGRTVA
ncbi:hypothetical protein CU044_2294 [Streptomyces sp. L-9-10]|nr:hypothetical protein CU044_2294 [Streptomyces sp. L-9-10]